MAASLLPKDLPAEAQGAAAQPSLPHHHHTSHPSHAHSHSHPTHSHTPHSHSHSSSSHTHSNPHHPLIHDPPSDDASNDSASEDDTPPSHPHAHPHSSSGSDEDGPAFDISQTPFAGLYTHLTSSIPLVTAVLLRLLVFTNVVASLLGLFHVLSPPSDSGCSVSMLDASSSPSYPRLFLSLFFDSTYPSAFTTTFAAYELGSRLETQLGSTFFLLLLSTFAAATTAAYYALLTAVPALRLYPCSCGAWPVIFPLLIVETWWNRKLPRSFPLFPYPLPSPAYPLLLTLLQQLTFGIHPYPLVALGVGYVVAVPAVLASLGVALTVERAVTGRWWAGYRRFVSREKAGTMLPWAPLVIKYVRCSAHSTSQRCST